MSDKPELPQNAYCPAFHQTRGSIVKDKHGREAGCASETFQRGLTQREWLAGLAMSGLVAADRYHDPKQALKIADEMLKAFDKEDEETFGY